MLSFLKAAPVAALSLTLLSAASFSDAGFAFGANGADTQLAADTITIDTSVLTADAQARDEALYSDKADQGFTPGIADIPEAIEEASVVAPTPANLAEIGRAHV